HRHHRHGQRRGTAGEAVLPESGHLQLLARGQNAPGAQGVRRHPQRATGVRRRLDRRGAVVDGHPQDDDRQRPAIHLHRWPLGRDRPRGPGMGTVPRAAERTAGRAHRAQLRLHGDLL
ncbi:hypothetical protein XPR_1774, partial [Xanthomonas arboricola pv. pruni MAFF 301420]